MIYIDVWIWLEGSGGVGWEERVLLRLCPFNAIMRFERAVIVDESEFKRCSDTLIFQFVEY